MYNITDDDIIGFNKRLKSETYTSIGTSASGMCVCSSGYIGN